MHIDDLWCSGGRLKITRDALLEDIEQHTQMGGKIFVGCDSNMIGEVCTFAHAICLYNESARAGGRYYCKTSRVKMKLLTPPQTRIVQEAQNAIEIAIELAETFPSERIEVHLDVNTRRGFLSQALADQLSGYVKASGFTCRLKPDSWAAAGIADSHTR